MTFNSEILGGGDDNTHHPLHLKYWGDILLIMIMKASHRAVMVCSEVPFIFFNNLFE